MLNYIRAAMNDVFDRSEVQWTRDDWTREVKTALCRVARQFNPDLGVSATGVDDGLADEGEWLF